MKPSRSCANTSGEHNHATICTDLQAVATAHLLDFFNLLVKTSNHVICGVRNLLHLHEVHKWVHLAGENKVQYIAIIAQCNACGWCDLIDVNTLV